MSKLREKTVKELIKEKPSVRHAKSLYFTPPCGAAAITFGASSTRTSIKPEPSQVAIFIPVEEVPLLPDLLDKRR